MRCPKPLVCALVLISAAFLSASASGLTIVDDGRPVASIVLSDAPQESQKIAAEELRYHVEKMSGASLPIIAAPQAGQVKGALVFVGACSQVRALGVRTEDLPHETILIKTSGNCLILAGDDSDRVSFAHSPAQNSGVFRTGTLYAVYDFLQDQLGVQWIWPGPSGEVTPTRRTIQVGNLDICEKPKLLRRMLRPIWTKSTTQAFEEARMGDLLDTGASMQRVREDEEVWLRRMRMGKAYTFNAGHAFGSWWAEYKDKMPEIFALQPDGARGFSKGKENPRMVKMCVANPALWDLQLRLFREQLAKTPLAKSLNSCENDGSAGFCTCPLCRAWDAPADAEAAARIGKAAPDGSDIDARGKAGPDGLPASLTPRYARWWNELARRVRAVDPDGFVVTYAYSRYRFAPAGLRLEPNLLIGQVGFSFYPMSADRRQSERDDFLAWSRAGARMFFRPNSLYFTGHVIPFNVTRQLAEDFQFVARQGIISTDFDSVQGAWAMNGPMTYVLARLQWDTEADIDALIREYYGAFGPLAPVAREYDEYWEAFTAEKWGAPATDGRIRELSPTSGARGRILVIPELYAAGAFEAGRAILRKGQPLLEGATPAERQRFENLSVGLRHAEVTTQLLAAAAAVKNYTNGDIRGMAAAQRDLLRLRREIALRSVCNVYWATYQEIRIGDLLRMDMLRDLGDREGILRLNLDSWRFRFDPEGKGEAAEWFKTRPGDQEEAAGWVSRMRGDQPWELSVPGQDWKKQHGGDYNGVGWYAVKVAVPGDEPGAVLHFPGICGDARVWVDGQLAGQLQAQSGPAPLDVEVTPFITPGKAFNLVVRVDDRGREGGIVRPVYVVRPQKK